MEFSADGATTFTAGVIWLKQNQRKENKVRLRDPRKDPEPGDSVRVGTVIRTVEHLRFMGWKIQYRQTVARLGPSYIDDGTIGVCWIMDWRKWSKHGCIWRLS